MNIQEATLIELSEEERVVLEGMVRSQDGTAVVRAGSHRAAGGPGTVDAVDCGGGRLHHWHGEQVAGVVCRGPAGGAGRQAAAGFAAAYDASTGRRILALLDEAPPAGHARWTAPLLSRALGDVSDQYIWRFLRAQRIDLAARKSWCTSSDPQFVAKAAEIVGLYLAPPENAIILAVDEKPHIQALERAQGYLKLANGRALTGQSHEYRRHGTTTLFAALDVATGEVTVAHYQRRRRIEFLDFMNRVVATHPGREIHVVLDNLSTHKPKNDQWLARHPNVRFHFTPTHASWLNQVEIWFSILSRSALAGASFTSPAAVRQRIDAFVQTYNQSAKPFAWTKTHVAQKNLKPRFADL